MSSWEGNKVAKNLAGLYNVKMYLFENWNTYLAYKGKWNVWVFFSLCLFFKRCVIDVIVYQATSSVFFHITLNAFRIKDSDFFYNLHLLMCQILFK